MDQGQAKNDEMRRQAEIEAKIRKASIYANEKCKDCWGRGYFILDMIDKNRPTDKYFQYCSCVYKNMKKYS